MRQKQKTVKKKYCSVLGLKVLSIFDFWVQKKNLVRNFSNFYAKKCNFCSP